MEPLYLSMVSAELSSGIIPFISVFQMQRCSAPGPAQEPGKNWGEVGSG